MGELHDGKCPPRPWNLQLKRYYLCAAQRDKSRRELEKYVLYFDFMWNESNAPKQVSFVYLVRILQINNRISSLYFERVS